MARKLTDAEMRDLARQVCSQPLPESEWTAKATYAELEMAERVTQITGGDL